MAPDYPPSLIVLDLRFVAERLIGNLQYVETATERPLRVRLDADSCPQGFVSVGDGVAFVADDDDLLIPPASPDAIPEDMGAGRYRRREQLRPNTTSATLILILPRGYALVHPSPPLATAKDFHGRIAVCWPMRGDSHGHRAVEWSLEAIDQEQIPGHLQALLRGSVATDHEHQVGRSPGASSIPADTAPMNSFDILSAPNAPGLARNASWFAQHWKTHPWPVVGVAATMAVVVFGSFAAPMFRGWISAHFNEKAAYVSVVNFGIAQEDTSIFVNVVVHNQGISGASITSAFVAASDSTALTRGWRGAVNLYANGPLQPDLPPNGQVTYRLHFYHAAIAALAGKFPAGSRVHLSLNFVTLDDHGQQHWARSEFGALDLFDSSIAAGLLLPRDVVRFKLIPTGTAPPFPSAPPFEHGGMSGPVYLVPVDQRNLGSAKIDSNARQ